jgi:IS30 family transposase
MISKRPAEVEDRAVPGSLGRRSHHRDRTTASAVGTLVERTTRYVVLVHLPDGRFPAQGGQSDAGGRCGCCRRKLVRTITWDQGRELAPARVSFTCRHRDVPDLLLRSPQPMAARIQREHQRTACVNTCRRAPTSQGCTPKRTSRTSLGALNDRPRKMHGFMKPSEKLAELLALTG